MASGWPHKQCATSNFSNLRKRKAKQRGELSEECSRNVACGGGKQAKGMRISDQPKEEEEEKQVEK